MNNLLAPLFQFYESSNHIDTIDCAFHYGSSLNSKNYNDIDIFIISKQCTHGYLNYKIGSYDIVVVSEKEFAKLIHLFDPGVMEPTLTGRIIKGNSACAELQLYLSNTLIMNALAATHYAREFIKYYNAGNSMLIKVDRGNLLTLNEVLKSYSWANTYISLLQYYYATEYPHIISYSDLIDSKYCCSCALVEVRANAKKGNHIYVEDMFAVKAELDGCFTKEIIVGTLTK